MKDRDKQEERRKPMLSQNKCSLQTLITINEGFVCGKERLPFDKLSVLIWLLKTKACKS